MATNNYTTKTASLRATKADVNNLDTKRGTIDELNSTTGTIGTLNSTTGEVSTLTVKTINGSAPIVEVKSGDNGYTGSGVETRTSNNKTTVTISTNQKWTLRDSLPIAEAVMVSDGKAIMADGSKIDINTNMIESIWVEQPASIKVHEWCGDMLNLDYVAAASFTDTSYRTSPIFSDNLTSFIGDMPILTTARSMFLDCKNLTTYIGDLGSLRIGGNKYSPRHITTGMFTNTNLTLDSVKIIADSINDLSVMTLGYKQVDESNIVEEGLIGISWYELPTDTELQNKLVDALNGIVLKGWQVATNTELVTIAQTKGYIMSTGGAESPGFHTVEGIVTPPYLDGQ